MQFIPNFLARIAIATMQLVSCEKCGRGSNNDILPVGRKGGRKEEEEGGRKRREGGRRGGREEGEEERGGWKAGSKECLIYPPQVTSASSESNLHFDKSPTLLERNNE